MSEEAFLNIVYVVLKEVTVAVGVARKSRIGKRNADRMKLFESS